MGEMFGFGLIIIVLMILWFVCLYLIISGEHTPSLVQLFSFLALLGVSAALGYMFLVNVLGWNPNPLRVNISRFLTEDRTIYLGDVVPGIYDLDYIRRIDADGEGTTDDSDTGDQWLAFYRYDVVTFEDRAPGGPYGASLYEPDGCRPPSILAFELVPVSYDYLGQDEVDVRVNNVIQYADPLSNSLDRPEVIISGKTRGVVTDLNFFRKTGIKQDQCLPWRKDSSYPTSLQLTSPFHYQNVGSFRGSYKVQLSEGETDPNTVTVWDSGGFERSQLTVRKQYRPGSNGSYLRPEGQDLWAPVEYSLDFGPGQPDRIPQVYYPEKAVLAFYLNLTKDQELLDEAEQYLSPRAQQEYDMRADPFGLSTDPASVARARGELARVLVWEIRYEPDVEAEQQHEARTVEATVVGVDKDGNIDYGYPCQVTWRVVGITNPQAQPYGCEWRLDSYVSSCQP
jgi:hypothetical protein